MNSTVHYKEQSDETLVALTLMRDEAAFEELVIRHRKAALLIANTVTRNTYTAEDAVQDAFLCAWQRLDTLKDAAKFGPWVCRIAKYRAINLAKRYKDYIPFDEVENYVEGVADDVTGYYNDKLESELLRTCVEKLSEKLRVVVHLHYFEGLSVSDIAKRMSIAEGTVKSRLSAGRDMIRKELGYVDQNNKNETLVEAVMRRVEEFKEWRLKNSKVGFEEDYKDVLAKVEELPDSEKKFYAMADVLKLGYWYLSDGETEEMRKKLKETAIKGNNKEVLALCIGFGKDKYSGQEKVDYVYNVILPEMAERGIPEYGAYEHYWLGYQYLETRDFENARKEFELAIETAKDGYPLYTALAKSTLDCMDGVGDRLSDRSRFCFDTTAEELFLRGNTLYYSQQPGFTRAYLDIPNYAKITYCPLFLASRVDHLVYNEDMKVGDTVTDSTGKITLTCVSADATVSTPSGEFHGCVEMHTYDPTRKSNPAPVFVAWYKRNIGLVAYGWKQPDGEVFGKTTLKEYTIVGGLGLIPFCKGNSWSYCVEGLKDDHTLRITVTDTRDDKVYLSYVYFVLGEDFDKDSWKDNFLYARNNYYNGDVAVDVSAYLERTMVLARTPWEAMTAKVAKNVMDRIYHGDPDANPDTKSHGLWNFFQYYIPTENDGKVTFKTDRTFEFEWKGSQQGMLSMCFNFIYEILQTNLGSLWNDEWLTYADRDEEFRFHRPARWKAPDVEFTGYGKVFSGETVTTTLGTFENCLRIRARTSQNETPGITYQNTDKDYYFAPGIGLVRIITYVTSYEDIRIYDLVSYKGTGEGYMPVCEGLERHYRFLNENEPHIQAGASYYYVKDNDGNLVILGDQLGMMDRE